MPKRKRDAYLRNRRPLKQTKLEIDKTEDIGIWVQKWLDRRAKQAKKKVGKH